MFLLAIEVALMKGRRMVNRLTKARLKLPANIVFLVSICCFLMAGVATGTERKRQRFEVTTLFHPADPFFGKQLDSFINIVEADSDGKLRLRRSRKAPGFSAVQIVQSLSAGGIDAALLDPLGLGFRPAVAQVFGGIPFGPDATKIVSWAESDVGSSILNDSFGEIGVKAVLCGHGNRISGVFSREEFVWPDTSGSLAIHSRGLANEVYKNINIVTRPLPPGDLYMGYASGVVDLLVSLTPSMDARTGFAQQSAYFYYPSWERSSSFALLLVSQKKWGSLPTGSRRVIEDACQSLNRKLVVVDNEVTLSMIAEQGANDTVVTPWPSGFLQAARHGWVKSASKLAERHPTLELAFEVLDVPVVPAD